MVTLILSGCRRTVSRHSATAAANWPSRSRATARLLCSSGLSGWICSAFRPWSIALLDLTFLQKSEGEIVLSAGVLWLQPDGCFELGNRLVELTFPAERDPEVVMRADVFRIRDDCLAEIRDRLVRVTLFEQRVAQAVGGIRVARANSESGAKLLDCFLWRAVLRQGLGEITAQLAVVRAKPNHFPKMFDRLRAAPCFAAGRWPGWSGREGREDEFGARRGHGRSLPRFARP